MNELNQTPDEQQQASGFGEFRRTFSKTLKIIVIGALILLLMIPIFMIRGLIDERGATQQNAIEEVSNKWSLPQTISGPYLSIQYPTIIERNGKQETSLHDLVLFPDELSIDGQLNTEILQRGIYKVNVYQSVLTLKGTFSTEELKKNQIDIDKLQFEKAFICMNLTDMRGISEQVSIAFADSTYLFEPGMDNRGISNTGIHVLADLSVLKQGSKIPYEMQIRLKGSQSIGFIPLGKITQVQLEGNWHTPSFTGNYLPEQREVTGQEFSAQWQVLNLNRNYSQVMTDYNSANIKDVELSEFGVNLKIPVEQYQQNMRSVKYAFLIILLTFAVIFFTEIVNNTRIHALQYLLVGLALCLFYCLLLSFSEHIGFNPAYLLASVLTIALVGGYMMGITQKKKPALIMSALLGVLYVYIFVLIQLETYALLAGSLGLFLILAVVMYFSKKIDWFGE